jgi:anti-sigma factor ChrR (cupin superfamily)
MTTCQINNESQASIRVPFLPEKFMLLNADFTRRAVITPDHYHWTPSPQKGVERMMLDRSGEEHARATSIVRYAAESRFPEHTHPGGEEILVLAGTFTEADQDYPAGWYLRSPDGSSHTPSSHEGATIFVKLRQMRADEKDYVRLDTNEPDNWHGSRERQICSLYSSETETVCLLKMTAGEWVFLAPRTGGAELFVLKGSLTEQAHHYETGSWLRFPIGDMPSMISGCEGALIYLKTGHLKPDTLTGVTP